MKTYLFLLLFVFQAFSLSSQISLKGYNQEKIDPSLFEGRWKARWISYPGEAPNVYGVYHFRKSLFRHQQDEFIHLRRGHLRRHHLASESDFRQNLT